MRWRTIWLTTILVIRASAFHYPLVNTIDHEPLEVNDNVARDGPPVTINIPNLEEGENDYSTNVNNEFSTTTTETTTVTENTSTIEDNSDEVITTVEGPESELTTIDNSEDKTTATTDITSDYTNTDEDDVIVTPPSGCYPGNDQEECDNEGNGDNDNEGNGNNDNEEEDEENGGGDGNEDNGGDDDDNACNDGGDDNEGDGDCISNYDLIVETKSGAVQGFYWQDNKSIISYIDIPYGAINNPFQAATAASTWDTTHSVKDHNKRCPQLQDDIYVGDTDCLTLSIFKPLNAKGASVLFHIHGENFNTGSGDPFIYGPDYLVVNGVILVLPNYRLGALGFLCMQNETAPGNMALKDLSLALKWVSENIEAFGGNPENIAVSGDGKSGALAGLLALSPVSKDYISKVIAESGSFLSYWALDRDPLSTASELFERIANSRTEISLEDLTTAAVVMAGKDLKFRPCLETDNSTAFLVDTPYEMIKDEKDMQTSFLIGSAMHAGVHEALHQTEDSIKKLNEDSMLLLPEDLLFDTLTLKSQTGARVKTQYFGEEDIRLEDVEHLSLCFTDIGYLGPGIRSARLLVEAGATVFFYEFSFVGEMNRVLQSVNHPVEGAVRGDIVGYLFTQDGVVPGEQQTSESKMIDMLTEMWTSFLMNGIPSTESIEWDKLENKDHLKEEWLLIDSEPKMNKGLHLDRLPLWTEIYEKYYIDGNYGHELSPSVYTVLILQLIFWLGFCRNISHVY